MAKVCQQCGQPLSFRNSFYYQDKNVCKECCLKLTAGTESPKAGTQLSMGISYQFKSLLGYGNLISFLGWIEVIAGLVGLIIAFTSKDEVLGYGGGMGGIILIVMGFGIVAAGQLISCIVSIERNTRASYELLLKNLQKTHGE